MRSGSGAKSEILKGEGSQEPQIETAGKAVLNSPTEILHRAGGWGLDNWGKGAKLDWMM